MKGWKVGKLVPPLRLPVIKLENKPVADDDDGVIKMPPAKKQIIKAEELTPRSSSSSQSLSAPAMSAKLSFMPFAVLLPVSHASYQRLSFLLLI